MPHGVEEAVGERLGGEVDDLQPRAAGPGGARPIPSSRCVLPRPTPPWITSGLNDRAQRLGQLQRRRVGQAVAGPGHEVVEPPGRPGRAAVAGAGRGAGAGACGRGRSTGGRRGPGAVGAGPRAGRWRRAAGGSTTWPSGGGASSSTRKASRSDRPVTSRARRRGCRRSGPGSSRGRRRWARRPRATSPRPRRGGPPRRTRGRTATRPAARPPPPAASTRPPRPARACPRPSAPLATRSSLAAPSRKGLHPTPIAPTTVQRLGAGRGTSASTADMPFDRHAVKEPGPRKARGLRPVTRDAEEASRADGRAARSTCAAHSRAMQPSAAAAEAAARAGAADRERRRPRPAGCAAAGTLNCLATSTLPQPGQSGDVALAADQGLERPVARLAAVFVNRHDSSPSRVVSERPARSWYSGPRGRRLSTGPGRRGRTPMRRLAVNAPAAVAGRGPRDRRPAAERARACPRWS